MTADPPGDAQELDRRRLAIVATQAAGLRWQITLTVAIIAALVWRDVPPQWVILWVAAVLASRELRAAALVRLAAASVPSPRAKLRQAIRWNVLIGLTNGATALFLVWLDTDRAAILTMIIVSWAAGAVSTSPTIMPAFLAYATLVFVPLAAMWAIAGGMLGLGIAVLVLLFFGVQVRFARGNLATFEESFRIRQENEALAAQLAAALERAESANRAKSRFLAAASHDLRQPLHALSLYTSALSHGEHDAQTAEIARQIGVSVDTLRSLLDSLLDISKLDAGAVIAEPRPIRVGLLVVRVCESYVAVAAEKGIGVRCDCPADLVGWSDPVLLERVLRNLVDNAVKYTDAGGTITLGGARAADAIEIAVRDTGHGIPADQRERIFEEFYQLENPERDRGRGLGLGLAIVERLTRLLGITLELESSPGSGSTFRLRVPVAAPRAAGAPTASPAPGDAVEPPRGAMPADDALRGVRVLVLDDEQAVRSGMCALLAQFGCAPRAASDVAEALALAATEAPHIVLADYRLRGAEDGITAVRRLRERVPGMAALLISGDTAAERLQEAQASGITLLHKPVAGERLRVAMLAELRRAPAGAPRTEGVS